MNNCLRYKLYLENEDDEVGAVMETGSVPGDNDEDDGDGFHQGKENQRPNNQVGRWGAFNALEELAGSQDLYDYLSFVLNYKLQ